MGETISAYIILLCGKCLKLLKLNPKLNNKFWEEFMMPTLFPNAQSIW
jgi:hypothetical protein